tara:strand:+ start:2279 stop:3853 length:1575 start_codon:yes stop_codon:yes gene_type:complete
MQSTSKKQIKESDFQGIDEILDFTGMIKTFIRYKFVILGCTSVVTLFSVIYAKSLAPIWEGSFQIVLDSNKFNSNNPISGSSNFSALSSLGLTDSNTGLKTEVKILQSPSVLNPVYEFVKLEKEKKGINVSYGGWVSSLNTKLIPQTSILSLKYRDKDKSLILPVLNKLSNEYQLYSGRDRERGLSQGISYLEKQREIMKERSKNSMIELQSFALQHGLGNEDGLPISIDKKASKVPSELDIEASLKNSDSGSNSNITKSQRYEPYFKELAKLEAAYTLKSSLLKPNSNIMMNMEKEIKTLKEYLSRPKEVLLKYRELSRIAVSDESILIDIEDKLRTYNFDKARQSNPWDLISTPTLINEPVAPNKPNIAFAGLVGGGLLGLTLAIILDKRSGRIFSPEILKSQIPYPLLKTFPLRSIESWKNSIDLLVSGPLHKNGKTKFGLLTIGEPSSGQIKLFSDFFRDSLKDNELIVSSNLLDLNDCQSQLLLVSTNNITFSQLKLLREDFIIKGDSIVGWIFLDPLI